MALLSINAITQDGIYQNGTLIAADVAGDSVPASTGIFVTVANGDVGAHTVTVAKPATNVLCPPFGTVELDDIVISVPAGESRSFTIPSGFSDSSGNFAWTYDNVTSVTIGVFSLA